MRGTSFLSLPELRDVDHSEVHFDAPESAPGPRVVNIGAGQEYQRLVTFDVAGNRLTRKVVGVGAYAGDGLNLFQDINWAMQYEIERELSILLDDPSSAVTEYRQAITFQRGEWTSTVRSRVRLGSAAEAFLLTRDLDVTEGDQRTYTRSWNPVLPRENV